MGATPSPHPSSKTKMARAPKKNKSTGSLNDLEAQMSKTTEISTDSLDDLESQISKICCIDLPIPSEARSTCCPYASEARSCIYASEARSCCIYAVPVTLIDINGKKAYQPRVVSIGPYHRKEPQVKAMEKHKLEVLSLLLHRKQLDFNKLLESIRERVAEAKKCYSKEMNLESINDDRFLKMIVLDGCFLIELFRKAGKQKLFEFNDPLATMAWAVPYIYGDLLLLQNQIPFFVLERLFEISKMPGESDASLSLLALRFFNKVMQRPKQVIESFTSRPNQIAPSHLLDLVRSSFLTPHLEPSKKNEGDKQTCRLIHCISKLRRAGIKFELREADSFLDVKFRKGILRNGVIQMPNITMDYHMKSFLVNCLAFEQLHKSCTKQFTVYANFLDCLVNTAKDVDYLCDRNIIENYFGKDGDVVQFINKMGKDLQLAFEDDQFYLSQLFKDVDECYRNKFHVPVASFKRRYFNTPWSFISALAALFLLVLTFLQTFYTINPKM